MRRSGQRKLTATFILVPRRQGAGGGVRRLEQKHVWFFGELAEVAVYGYQVHEMAIRALAQNHMRTPVESSSLHVRSQDGTPVGSDMWFVEDVTFVVEEP